MAVDSLKLRESTLDVGKAGEVSKLRETYLLTVDADDTLLQIKEDAFASKPLMRQRHATAAMAAFVVDHISIDPTGYRSYRYVVDYTTMLDTYQSAAKPFTTLQRRTGTRRLAVWKMPTGGSPNYGLPTTGTVGWPPNTVATGTNVDIMGNPQNIDIWSHDLFVQVTIDVTMMQCLNGAVPFQLQNELTAYLLKRNSVAFLGYPIGKVVFLGWDEQLTNDPAMTINLRFKADDWFHLEQRILPRIDGGPYLTVATTWASKPIKQVDSAYWYQPYSRYGTIDFNLMAFYDQLLIPTPIQTVC